MPRTRSSIFVARPPSEVFAFVRDLENAARWDPRVVRAERLTEGPTRPGSRFLLTGRLLGKEIGLPYAVVELEEERRIVFAGETRILRYRDELECRPEAAGCRFDYRARLDLRGILALGNPLLGLFLGRVADDAVAGIRRLVETGPSAAGGPRGGGPPPGVSPEEIRRIVALDDRPELRNLLITQGYHQLSARLADLLGRDNANWCTYATWASKTAGFFIREEELDRALRRLLEKKGRLRRRLRELDRAMAAVHPDAALGAGDDLGPLLAVVGEVGRHIREGNRAVFAELGGLFAGYLAELGGLARSDPGRLDAFLAELRPGESRPDLLERRDGELVGRAQGGQDLLAAAFRAYERARFEPDAKRRAEAILLANALGGLHEQTRLESYIAASLAVPVTEIVYSRRNDALKERLARELLGPAQEVLHRRLAPLGEDLVETVRELSTRHLLRLALPGEVLELGEDVPAPVGAPLYPPHLERLEDPALVAALRRFGAYPSPAARGLRRAGWRRPTAAGSAAHDWGQLADRMRYIYVYFRSRQAWGALFDPPFSAAQTAEILAGRVPAGPL